MMKSENVEVFVRQILGCKCPEKVFEYIDCQHDIKLNNDILLSYKINIGNRLLIYIMEVNNCNFIKSNLSTLVYMGKSERDKRGFNRYRLVIVTDKINEIEQVAHTMFEVLGDKDEKVHLHVVNKNEFHAL